jgi:Ca2+-binding RTX toxin-like protein
MRRPATVLALACALVTVPGVAAASTVTADPATRDAVFSGGGGANDVTMSTRGTPFGSVPPFDGVRLWFIDAAQPLRAGVGCVAGLPVWCRAFDATVNLGGGNDRFGPAFSDGYVTVTGGSGQDHIDVNGNDDTASGGSGDDWLRVGGNLSGYGNGDSGDDDIRSFASSSTFLSGGSGDDLVYGDRFHNQLSGDSGNDDLILGGQMLSGSATGGSGGDVMVVLDDSPFSATVTLSGGAGGDVIVGQRGGTDTVSGESGIDVIDVSGDAGEADTVECGSGRDTVYADADDVVVGDCETVLSGPMPANGRVEAALARLADAFGVTAASVNARR